MHFYAICYIINDRIQVLISGALGDYRKSRDYNNYSTLTPNNQFHAEPRLRKEIP